MVPWKFSNAQLVLMRFCHVLRFICQPATVVYKSVSFALNIPPFTCISPLLIPLPLPSSSYFLKVLLVRTSSLVNTWRPQDVCLLLKSPTEGWLTSGTGRCVMRPSTLAVINKFQIFLTFWIHFFCRQLKNIYIC